MLYHGISRLQNVSTSEEEEDESESDRISFLGAYKCLDITGALQRNAAEGICQYIQAVQELTLIVRELYATILKKPEKEIIERDVGIAIKSMDWESNACRKAMKELSASISRTFPKQKRQKLCREMTQLAVRSQRDMRRKIASQAQLENHSFSDLPIDCKMKICSLLDPVSLVRLSIADKTWHGVAVLDDIWIQLLRLTFGEIEFCWYNHEFEKRKGKGNIQRHFSQLVLNNMDCLIPWQSRRVMCHGSIRWIRTPTWKRMLEHPGSHGISRNSKLKVFFLTPEEVILWLSTRDPNILNGFLVRWKEIAKSRPCVHTIFR